MRAAGSKVKVYGTERSRKSFPHNDEDEPVDPVGLLCNLLPVILKQPEKGEFHSTEVDCDGTYDLDIFLKLKDVNMTSKMVVSQPGPVMHMQTSADWGSRICDCCNDKAECCFAFWCCPCFACKTSERYGEPLCLPLLEVFSGITPAITMSMRVSMRKRYGIHGTMCDDCVMSTCCTSCVWCQMSREMRRREAAVILVNSKYT